MILWRSSGQKVPNWPLLKSLPSSPSVTTWLGFGLFPLPTFQTKLFLLAARTQETSQTPYQQECWMEIYHLKGTSHCFVVNQTASQVRTRRHLFCGHVWITLLTGSLSNEDDDDGKENGISKSVLAKQQLCTCSRFLVQFFAVLARLHCEST